MNLKNKTPTFSGYKLHKRYTFQGLDISIENRKGSYRHWKDRYGESGKTKMHYDYGYIKRTLGRDGDHVDCYVGPYKKSSRVFIIHQVVPTTKKNDEDKVMLGFYTKAQAKKAYLKHIPAKWFGSMDRLSMAEFKEKVLGKHVKYIKSFTVKDLERGREMDKAINDLLEENEKLYKARVDVEKTKGLGGAAQATKKRAMRKERKVSAGGWMSAPKGKGYRRKLPSGKWEYSDTMPTDKLGAEGKAEFHTKVEEHRAKKRGKGIEVIEDKIKKIKHELGKRGMSFGDVAKTAYKEGKQAGASPESYAEEKAVTGFAGAFKNKKKDETKEGAK